MFKSYHAKHRSRRVSYSYAVHGAEWGDAGDEQFTDDEPTEGEEHASYRLSPSRPPNLLTQLSPVPPPRTVPNPEASSSSDPLSSDGPDGLVRRSRPERGPGVN